MFVGVSIASASWLVFLISTVFMILHSLSAIPEKHSDLGKYGDAVREYMNKIPRWLGITKSAKRRQGRPARGAWRFLDAWNCNGVADLAVCPGGRQLR